MPLSPDMVPVVLSTGASARMKADAAPRFAPGDAVRALNLNPVGHTRLPRYVRGRVGTVDMVRGVFAFPDTTAHGLGHKPQMVYGVKFSARALWGPDASEADTLMIDLWDDYVEPA